MLTLVFTIKESDARVYLNEISRETEFTRCNTYPACDEVKCPSKRSCPFYFFVKNPEFLARAVEQLVNGGEDG